MCAALCAGLSSLLGFSSRRGISALAGLPTAEILRVNTLFHTGSRREDMTAPFVFDPTDIERQFGGRFTGLHELRVGGQGAVYRAERIAAADGSPAADTVALKLLLDPAQDERVDREIQAMQGVRHRQLATLIEYGTITTQGRQTRFVVWEFIEGQPLDHRIRRGALQARTVAIVGRDVALALDHIWARRIVHRDVNPKNIMLRTGDREAVLIDLGVARHLDQSTLTGAGSTWGTPGYLSPEQCRAETQLTCHSDVFCLGVSMMEALSGRHPTGRNQVTLIRATPRTAAVAPGAPVVLADLIDRMLHPRASFRPAPTDIASALAAIIPTL
jgi:eukaryotic-like serine/threonine-protein kinase